MRRSLLRSMAAAPVGFSMVSVGLVSSSSKLLYDYPEGKRSQVLDYLFRPNYGASLQILKVEIGGDTNSTTTAEPSHERTRGQVDCNRGYEWWLMEQAKERNPHIKLYGLMWGGPGWLSGIYSQDQVDYLMSWMGCARQNGLNIDYLGGANERGGSAAQFRSFYISLHQALAKAFPDTKVVASDEHNAPDYWRVATWMKGDSEFSNAVDILGEHDVCVWLSTYQHCNVSQDALNSVKPLWNSEQSSAIDGDGADALARAMNRGYIDARLTGNINWALTAGMYPDTATAGTGLILTDTPWSGYYQVTRDIWVDAQTTQFTAPGWRYIDGASGYLSGGASYVTLRDPSTGDYTIVVETTDATAPQTVRFTTSGGLSGGTVHEWTTNLASQQPTDWFVHTGDLSPTNHSIDVTFQPGRVYTLSTTIGQHKGTAAPGARPGNGQGHPGTTRDPGSGTAQGAAAQLPLPFHENFNNVGPTKQARYFQDVQGAFEAAPCQGGRSGTCYRQVLTQAPIAWHKTRNEPVTIVGDPRWWGDYRVGVDAMLEQPGYVDLISRIENYDGASVAGYHFQVADTGAWKIYTEDENGTDIDLAAGTTSAPGVGSWHELALSFHGAQIAASVDGRIIAQLTDAHHTTGQVGLGVSPYQNAEFDNLSVVPTGQAPEFVPHADMTATATSEDPSLVEYHRHPARYAIDDRVESGWQTDPSSTLPQSLTLDLGHPQSVFELTYKPPYDRRSGTADDITGYRIYLSNDGHQFRQVASGSWAATMATKSATWPPASARYIRLEATSSPSGVAAAREVNVARTPAPAPALKNVTAPAITGPGRVGSTLTSTPGTWSEPTPTLAYQWTRDGAPIAGATTATYLLTAADAGRKIALTVTASAAGFTPATASSNSIVVAKVASTISGSVHPVFALATRPITFTAKVWAADGVIPTGTVTVYDFGSMVTTATLPATGSTVTVSLPRLRPGFHLLTARYSGSDQVNGSIARPVLMFVL